MFVVGIRCKWQSIGIRAVLKGEVPYAALTEMFTRIHREHFNGKINKEK